MASPMPLLSIIFAVGMVLGGVVLTALPLAPERGKPLVTSVRVAELSAPCRRQAASKDDRGCAARAPARNESARQTPPEFAAASLPQPVRSEIVARAAPIAAPSPPPRQRIAAAFAQLPPRVESIAMSPVSDDAAQAAVAAPSADPRPARRAEAPHPPRSVGGPIPITAVAANGARRTIVIRPTSQQDFYYYAARRQFAAAGSALPR